MTYLLITEAPDLQRSTWLKMIERRLTQTGHHPYIRATHRVFLICSVTSSEDSFMSSESTFWQRASFSTLPRWLTTIGCGGATNKYISTFKLRKRKGVSIKEPDLRDRRSHLVASPLIPTALLVIRDGFAFFRSVHPKWTLKSVPRKESLVSGRLSFGMCRT